MLQLAQIEKERADLQVELDAAKTQQERNELGQFATPPALATDIVREAKRLWRGSTKLKFLDPAFGTGAFYEALLKEFPNHQVASAKGFEIDPHYGSPAKALWKKSGLELKIADFTELKEPTSNERANLLICNPPYVRHHHLSRAQKDHLGAVATKRAGTKIGGLSGLYCYYMAIAHAWLSEGALSCWLIPSEFMDVNYGEALKRYLLEAVELIHIHRFDPNDEQFDDALVSSAVVWFRNSKPNKDVPVSFSYGGSLQKPRTTRTISREQLSAKKKWSSFAEQGVGKDHLGNVLGDLFHIKRGLATGDNKFFVLNKKQIEDAKLPRKLFRPILPGPRYLPSDVVETRADGTPLIERELFLLDCKLPEDVLKKDYPTLWAYLQTGKPDVSETYLCGHRSPWYAQENRPAPPLLCTYMGRGAERREKPFRFILNRSQATAANVYLLLYPKPALLEMLKENESAIEEIWRYLKDVPSDVLLRAGRVYGGGLYKLEPKELANLPLRGLPSHFAIKAASSDKADDLFNQRAA